MDTHLFLSVLWVYSVRFKRFKLFHKFHAVFSLATKIKTEIVDWIYN